MSDEKPVIEQADLEGMAENNALLRVLMGKEPMTPRNDRNARVTDRNDWLAGYDAARQQAAALIACGCPEGRCWSPGNCSCEDVASILEMQPEAPPEHDALAAMTADRDAWRAQAEQTYPGKGAKP